MKLFKYFLTYEGKKLLPEKIIEDLWEYNDFKNPYNVLRTQISRVRKIIDWDKVNIKCFFEIQYKNGYYLFKLEDGNTLDFKDFKLLVREGNSLLNVDVDKGMSMLKDGISLYKGGYLQELEDEDWVIIIRNRYNRLYFRALENYLKVLKDRKMYNEIIDLCEKAIEYEPYEETLHLYYLESLMKIGQDRYALNHYNFYTSMFYNDLGLVPSESAKEIYKRLQFKEEKVDKIIDLNIAEDLLKNTNSEGPLICDFSYFKFLYNFEIKNAERHQDRKVFLGIITIDNMGCMPLGKDEMEKNMGNLLDIINSKLRKGDVISKWNHNQLMVLIYGIQEKDLYKINERLRGNFKKQVLNKDIILNIKYKKI